MEPPPQTGNEICWNPIESGDAETTINGDGGRRLALDFW